MIKLKKIKVKTKGYCDVIDITKYIEEFIDSESIKNGQIVAFVPGSTAGITTIEYEEGLIGDIKETFEKLIPSKREYQHDKKWGDGNGFSHIRSSFLGTSLVVPIDSGKLFLGSWQQIVLVDFDNRERNREVLIQLSGE